MISDFLRYWIVQLTLSSTLVIFPLGTFSLISDSLNLKYLITFSLNSLLVWSSPSDIKIRIGLKKSFNGGTDILYVLIIVWFSSDTTPVKSNSQDSESNSQTQLQVISHILVNQTKFWYILGSPKTNQLGNQVKHLLIILSILLLSSPVIGQETGVWYQYETSLGTQEIWNM